MIDSHDLAINFDVFHGCDVQVVCCVKSRKRMMVTVRMECRHPTQLRTNLLQTTELHELRIHVAGVNVRLKLQSTYEMCEI